jgi:hypothetical protein
MLLNTTNNIKVKYVRFPRIEPGIKMKVFISRRGAKWEFLVGRVLFRMNKVGDFCDINRKWIYHS